MIHIVSPSRYKLSTKQLKKDIAQILSRFIEGNDMVLNIVFVGKIKMRQIASTYKHEDVALPVLSFPYKGEEHEGEKLLGEIIICYPQAVLLAAERNKKVDDMLLWLIDHGIKNLITN